jgi:hypothetical protein
MLGAWKKAWEPLRSDPVEMACCWKFKSVGRITGVEKMEGYRVVREVERKYMNDVTGDNLKRQFFRDLSERRNSEAVFIPTKIQVGS